MIVSQDVCLRFARSSEEAWRKTFGLTWPPGQDSTFFSSCPADKFNGRGPGFACATWAQASSKLLDFCKLLQPEAPVQQWGNLSDHLPGQRGENASQDEAVLE